MLVLSRLTGQWIAIGEDIRVHVTRKGARVSLAIDAPKHVPVVRGELVECKHDDNNDREAA